MTEDNSLSNGKINNNRRIIDMHAHIFPHKIADKAVHSIADFYGVPINQNGSVQDLLRLSEEAGICKTLVHSTATKPQQVKSINSFIFDAVSKSDKLIGFGTLHPDFDDIDNEVQKMIEHGLKGVKLHPDFQEFYIDDPKAFKMYEACKGRLPILFHTGDDLLDFSRPKKLSKVLDKFPDLVVIAAHLGGYRRWEESYEYLAGRDNLYFDTCSAVGIVDNEFAIKIIQKHGVDKIFFASDYPMWNPKDEMAKVLTLGLSDSELEQIFYSNAYNFLKSIT